MTTTKMVSTVVLEGCCNCGGPIAMTTAQKMIFQENHETFYCPRGHQNHWPQETRAEKLQKQLQEQRSATARAEDRLKESIAEKDGLLDEMNRHRRRSAAGVCQFCNRSFRQVRRHVKRMHPEEAG